MSASAVLAALAQVLPTGTPIGPSSVFIQRGISVETAVWPALLLECPDTQQVRKTMGPPGAATYQQVHEVHGVYVDRWDSSARTYEQLHADADSALEHMLANLRANPSLSVAGVATCQEAGDQVTKRIYGLVRDEGLGFPVISGELVIQVKDFYTT